MGSIIVFFIYLFFFNLIFSIIVFKFFITYPPNACTQGGLGTPDMSRIVRTFSVAGDTAPNSKCLEQRSPIKSSFRHGLTLGTQTRSIIRVAPHHSNLFSSGLTSFLGRLSTPSFKVADSGSNLLDALLQVTVVKVPQYDSHAVV